MMRRERKSHGYGTGMLGATCIIVTNYLVTHALIPRENTHHNLRSLARISHFFLLNHKTVNEPLHCFERRSSCTLPDLGS